MTYNELTSDYVLEITDFAEADEVDVYKRQVQEITGIEVKERVPDSVLQEADEVVNIDLTAEELISRLKAGKKMCIRDS